MDDFASDESQSEDEFFTTINQQRAFLEKLQNECGHYNHVISELKKEIKDRNGTLEKIQTEIEDCQMNIIYNELKIEKTQNVFKELKEASEDQETLDPQERIEAGVRLDNEVTKNLKKFINRTFYSKKAELEEKMEKAHHQYSAVCVKYYKEDPTSEEYGVFNAQSYSYKVFGLSKELTFKKLIELAKEQWCIEGMNDYILTDQEHHDLTLLLNVPISQFLTHETPGYAMFILRKRNTTMKELVTSQKAAISPHETHKESRIKEELGRAFDALRKAKPGIYTYEAQQEEVENFNNSTDGSFFNFLTFLAVLILMCLSMSFQPIAPSDTEALKSFNFSYSVPQFLNPTSFRQAIPDLLYDLNPDGTTIEFPHFIPVGVKRLIMNKMLEKNCVADSGQDVCSYDDSFTSDNLDTSSLTQVPNGPWSTYTKAEGVDSMSIHAEQSHFDGSGFIYDFPTKTTKQQALDLLNNNLYLDNNNGDYFGISSRAFLIHALYYEVNHQTFIDRFVIFEFTTTGLITTTERKTYYKPYADDDSDDARHFRTDIALLVATAVAYFFNIIRTLWKTRKFKELYKLLNIVKYINVALVVSYFILYHQKSHASTDEILGTTTHESFEKEGSQRQTATNLLLFAFFIHCVTMIRSFVFSQTIHTFMNIFAVSFKDLLAFFLIFLSLFLGFTFTWWIAFSLYIDKFQTFFSSVFELFLFYGTGDLLSFKILYQFNEFWIVFLVIFTCILVFVQFDSLLTSIMLENVRCLYMKSGSDSADNLPFKKSLNTVKGKFSRFGASLSKAFSKRCGKKDKKAKTPKTPGLAK